MPDPPKTFVKAAVVSSTEVDAWHHSSFQVFYDGEDRVEYIEVSATEEIRAVVDGLDVLRLSAERVVEHFTRRTAFDQDDPELGYSYIFPELDLSFWRPAIPDDEPTFAGGPAMSISESRMAGRTFVTVGIGRRGYYRRHWRRCPAHPDHSVLSRIS